MFRSTRGWEWKVRCQHGRVLVRALDLTVGLIGTEGLWSSGIKGDIPSDIWEQKALLSRRPHLEGRVLETEPQVQGGQAVKSKQRPRPGQQGIRGQKGEPKTERGNEPWD